MSIHGSAQFIRSQDSVCGSFKKQTESYGLINCADKLINFGKHLPPAPWGIIWKKIGKASTLSRHVSLLPQEDVFI